VADPLPDLVGLEAHQLHQRLIAAQQVRQGMQAFDATQGLQPVAQEILYEGDHLPWDGGPMDLFPQGHDVDRLQEVEAVVQQRPFVQPVHPVDQWLPGPGAGRRACRRAGRLASTTVLPDCV
jgi:hypothetical protein